VSHNCSLSCLLNTLAEGPAGPAYTGGGVPKARSGHPNDLYNIPRARPYGSQHENYHEQRNLKKAQAHGKAEKSPPFHVALSFGYWTPQGKSMEVLEVSNLAPALSGKPEFDVRY
jgi:hypothetical protein